MMLTYSFIAWIMVEFRFLVLQVYCLHQYKVRQFDLTFFLSSMRLCFYHSQAFSLADEKDETTPDEGLLAMSLLKHQVCRFYALAMACKFSLDVSFIKCLENKSAQERESAQTIVWQPH